MDKSTDTVVPVVLKPTGTVQISNKFSLIERRLLNTLVYFAQKNRLTTDELSLSILELMPLLGLENSNNYEVIRDAIRVLTGTLIEWNIFGEDKVHEWGVCTFLSSGKLVRGKLKFRLNPEIVQQITHPRLFAKIQLLVQTQLHKRHSLILYEFLLDCISRNKAQRLVINNVQIEKIFKLMGLEGTKYSEIGNFKVFNRDILKPSIGEINQYSDVTVAIQLVRANRQIIALTLTIERKPVYQIQSVLQAPVGDENLGSYSSSLCGQGKLEEETLVNMLTDKGVGIQKARELVKNHTTERIVENIELVNQRQAKNDKIKNPAAYLVKAIDEDYRPRKTDEQLHAEQKVLAQQAINDAKKDRDKLVKEWEQFRIQRVQAYFAAQSLTWQEQRRQQFVDALTKNAQSNGNSILFLIYQKHGFNSKLVQAGFFADLCDELLVQPEEKNIDEYINWRSD